jgi:hypothetical protein
MPPVRRSSAPSRFAICPSRKYLIDDSLIAGRVLQRENQTRFFSPHCPGKVLYHRLIWVDVAVFNGTCLAIFTVAMVDFRGGVALSIERGIYA